MTQTQARDIAANLRQGRGHYTVVNSTDKYATRIYRIKLSKLGQTSVYLGLGKGWKELPAGKAIYSDQDSYLS